MRCYQQRVHNYKPAIHHIRNDFSSSQAMLHFPCNDAPSRMKDSSHTPSSYSPTCIFRSNLKPIKPVPPTLPPLSSIRKPYTETSPPTLPMDMCIRISCFSSLDTIIISHMSSSSLLFPCNARLPKLFVCAETFEGRSSDSRARN